ncbi:MAG TPA: Gfo/Idh/MocA family oxidoreductase [Gaiellales bacterium]|nr:Gfo/Idh/MocA family oxidoreductase [Gaiellales bacterium]
MRIGLIGAGAIARRHVGVLSALDGVELAAVCDSDLARAESIAAGAALYGSWQQLLEHPLEAVFVCTPPAAHAEPAIAALRRGLAVYLEKPLARAAADGEAIVAAWHESGGVCAVGYQWRSLALLGRVRDGLAGAAPGMLISRSVGPTEPGRAASWFGDPAASGGILFELGSHDIDLQQALAGPAASVQALSGRGLGAGGGALDDAVAVLVRYAAGGLGVISVAWTDMQEPPIYGLDVLAPEVALHLALDPEFRLAGRAHGETVDEEEQADPRTSAVTGFLDAARRRDPTAVACTPEDALGTLRVALAAEQAIAGGEAVRLEG